MKQRYVFACMGLSSIYIGFVLSGAFMNMSSAQFGIKESKKPHYSESQRQEWKSYGESKWDILASPKVLIPFNHIFYSEGRPQVITPMEAKNRQEINELRSEINDLESEVKNLKSQQ